MANPLENICEKLTYIHMVVYTWWCWHIYKGDKVGVDVDQLSEGTEVRRVQNSTGGVSGCPPVECGQSDGATGALFRKDRVSQSGPDTGHVVTRCWVPVSGQKWE